MTPKYNAWIYANPAFSPIGAGSQLLQDDSQARRLYLHNVETGEVRVIAEVKRVSGDPIFSPDGSLLALRQIDKLGFWKVHTGILEYEFTVCGGTGPDRHSAQMDRWCWWGAG